MPATTIQPRDQPWITGPHADGASARHVTELSEVAGTEHVRASVYAHGWPAEDEHAELLESAV